MTVLIAGGDSFTYGTELQSPKNTWSALLASKLGMNYSCCARPGNSNGGIVRSVMTACHKIQTNDIAVAVMFTFPNRHEFKFAYDTGERGSPWYSITPWTHANESLVKDQMPNEDKKSFLDFLKHRDNARQTGVADFSDMYYNHLSDDWGMYTSLKEIFLLQSYLQVRGIPYLFTYADTSMFKSNTPVEQNILADLIDYRSYTKHGFYEWAMRNQFEFGGTHPLEQAHEAFVNLLGELPYSFLR